MGGDYAPNAVVEGVALALNEFQGGIRYVLYGPEASLKPLLAQHGLAQSSEIEIVECSQAVAMHDHPVHAIKKLPDSTIVRGIQDLAAGRIDTFASAGNTGAMMAGVMQFVKSIPGVLRPAISSYLPVGETRGALLLDVGLNVDCKPEVLDQYGLLGSLFAQFMLGVEKPRVALLNVGSESEKGSLLARSAHELMAQNKRYHFIGNVEGNQLFNEGCPDVVVTDGFTGNVVLKTAEAFYSVSQARGIEDAFFKRFNFEHYGGTPVLGINAPVIIGHGISNEKAIKAMIKMAIQGVEAGLCEKFKSTFFNV